MKRAIALAVFFAVAGGFAGRALAEPQPKMEEALRLLREAKGHLEQATHDKGGHRAKAIEHVNEAIREVEEGIRFDDRHDEHHEGRH
jgi:hypothetical protein